MGGARALAVGPAGVWWGRGNAFLWIWLSGLGILLPSTLSDYCNSCFDIEEYFLSDLYIQLDIYIF